MGYQVKKKAYELWSQMIKERLRYEEYKNIYHQHKTKVNRHYLKDTWQRYWNAKRRYLYFLGKKKGK
jgi:hypothetical protein